MKRVLSAISAFFILQALAFSQGVAMNTSGTPAAASTVLDLNSGNAGNKGFLPEKVSLTASNVAAPITSPATGLFVYNTATAGTTPNNVFPGYYYWNGSMWVRLLNSSKVSGILPYLEGTSLFGANYYTTAHTPCPTAPTTPCATAYNFPGPLPTAGQPQNITTSFLWGTYNSTGYGVSTDGYFFRSIGWITSGTTGTVTVLAYVYTLTNNSSAMSGTLINQVNVNVTNDGKIYYFEIPSPASPVALSKGQIIMLWYFPSVNMTNVFSNGDVETTMAPE